MKVNKPIPKLTKVNLGGIIDNFETKYKMGFTMIEVRRLLAPNKLEEVKFMQGMFGSAYIKIENNDVYYHRDVYNILRELI